MKIFPINIFKRHSAIKKLAARQQERDMLVTISPNLKNKDEFAILKDSESALKAFADKNKIALNIKNGSSLFKNRPMIEIFNQAECCKKNKSILHWYKGLTPLTEIFPKIKDKSELLRTLKRVLKNNENKRVHYVNNPKKLVKIIDDDVLIGPIE